MLKETFKEQMLKLKHFYPNWKLDLSNKEVVKDWYNKLKKYNKKDDKIKE